MPAKKTELTITVDGKSSHIPVKSFFTVLSNTIGILNGLAQTLGKDSEHPVIWEITKVSMNSPLTMTIAGQRARKPSIAARAVDECIVGLRMLEEKSNRLPKHFTDNDIESAIRIVSVLTDGVREVTFESPKHGRVSPTLHLTANAHQVRAKHYRHEMTSFRGKLCDITTSHGAHEFVIYDQITDQSIKCLFPPDRIASVGGLLTKRVEVHGNATFNHKGIPLSIDVVDFSEIPTPKYAKISEAPPVSITGGIDPVRYIRKLRNGERL